MTRVKIECYVIISVLTLCVIFLFSTCVHVHAKAAASGGVNSNLKQQQQRDCPLWFYFDSETQFCHCFVYHGSQCFDNKAYLIAGFCATYDEDTVVISLSTCPYSQYHVNWYIQLPGGHQKIWF